MGKKNVLLLGVSPLTRLQGNRYIYKLKGNKTVDLEGILTNEAPAKAVIKKLYGNGEHLDRVVMLCTAEVLKPIRAQIPEEPVRDEHYDKNIVGYRIVQNTLEKLSCDIHDLNTVDYYREVVNSYARENKPKKQEEHSIEFDVVPVADYSDKDDISHAVIAAAKSVEAAGDEIDLYIDYNGSFRSMAYMLVSVANLMNLRGVTVKEILSMNFSEREEGRIWVKNQLGIFQSQQLVTGIDEYIKYGRVQGLKEYFKGCSESISKILDRMEEFSNNLLLCRAGYIMRQRGKLKKLLDNYIDAVETGIFKRSHDMQIQLFGYVVRDIRDGYQDLLSGELPDILNWCIKKGFMQQALTFCTEELPGYLWEKNIFRATPEEEADYRVFLQAAESVPRKYRPKGFEYSISAGDNASFAYAWMTSYLPYSADDRSYDYYRENPALNFSCIDESCDRGNVDKLQDMFRKDRNFGVQLDKGDWLDPARWMEYWRMGTRVTGDSVKEVILYYILGIYRVLKIQRNAANHASTSENDRRYCSYGKMTQLFQKLNFWLKKAIDEKEGSWSQT